MADPFLSLIRWMGLAPAVHIHPATEQRLEDLESDTAEAKQRLDKLEAIEAYLASRAGESRPTRLDGPTDPERRVMDS